MVVGLLVDYTESFLKTDIGRDILRPYPIERTPMRRASKLRVNNLRGFTLLEVLIATAVTLLLMMGLAQIFKVLGDSITKGRAGLELNNRLRNVIHRVRTDLDNITVSPRPPIKVGAGQGYLKYYDGPMHDAFFADNPLLNRFGDMDDIFMATVRADDAWFTGKVPRFVLEGRTGAAADANGNGILDDLNDLVTISSQFAEVIIFAEPLTSNDNNPTRNPVQLAANPGNSVVGLPQGFEDIFSGTAATPDGIPDAYRLHYRVLLIRPDLNLAAGILPNFPSTTPNNPLTRAMLAGAENLLPAQATTLPTPACDMFRIHQYCDLSIRRINDFDGTTVDFVAANSIEDLANPANRFAHVQYPITGSATLVSMPVLALGPTLPALVPVGFSPTIAGAGFLHPAFTLMGTRTGEDVLATDVLAFDMKAFDTSAPVIGYVGADGVASTDGLGAANSDDVVLRPGDPGFYTYGIAGLTAGPPTSAIQAYGEFVDINWSGKAGGSYVSVFSGVTSLLPTTATTPASLLKSGLARFDASGTLQIFQPAYDTFTDLFERDGVYQAQLAGSGIVVSLPGWIAGAESWRTFTDTGTDGLDNNTSGTSDESAEKETSPPFATDLRGLQISIRLEDRPTKQFKQMSTVKEFVTH